MVSRSRAGFTLNIIDTPGLIEGGYVNDMALNNIKRLALTLGIFKFFGLLVKFSLAFVQGCFQEFLTDY